jgi:hypothetical protein
MGHLRVLAFGTGDTNISRSDNFIVRWTEIYVPGTLYVVLISATINFSNSFVAFLLNL